MPLTEKEARIIVKLINRASVKWRQGILTPETIMNPDVIEELLDHSDQIKEIPRNLLGQLLLQVLSDSELLPLYELQRGMSESRQAEIEGEYTYFVKNLFGKNREDQLPVWGEFKEFIKRVRTSSSSPSTPVKQMTPATPVTPGSIINKTSLRTPTSEKKPEKEPANLQEMLDSLSERLDQLVFYANDVRKTTPHKADPTNKIQLKSLIRFLKQEAVIAISFANLVDVTFSDKIEGLAKLNGNILKLENYLMQLNRFGRYLGQLVPQDAQTIATPLETLQKKITDAQAELRKKIEALSLEVEPIGKKQASYPQSSEAGQYLIIRYYREKDRVREIHNVDSGGHLLLIVNYLDKETGQYKKKQLTLKRADKILEERSYPPEIQVHKLFSRNSIPSGDIHEGYFLSEEEIKEIDDRYRKSNTKAIIKEVRLEQKGIDYQAIGQSVAKYLIKDSENPFRYCFYRSDDADNCASLIYKLLALGGAEKYAQLKKEWGHITPKNVFAFGKAVEVALSKLALTKGQMQTQADYISSVAGIAFAHFSSEFDGDAFDITAFKTSLDAGKSLERPSLSELKTENNIQRVADILKQLYLFAHYLKKMPPERDKEIKGNIISYLGNALSVLDEIKASCPEKKEFFDFLIHTLEELQKWISDKHRLFSLAQARGLARTEVENTLKNLTLNANGELQSAMYAALQSHQKIEARSNIPAIEIADDRVFAAIITPTRESQKANKQSSKEFDEYDQQIADTLDLINTKIHIHPEMLGNEDTTLKYLRIIQLLNYFKVINEIDFNPQIALNTNLFAFGMNIKSALLQIRELQNDPVEGVPASFYTLIINQMQSVLGEVNRLIYFEMDTVKDPLKSNLNLTAELSVLLGQNATPVNVDDVLNQAEKTIRSELPVGKPSSVNVQYVKDVDIPSYRWTDHFKFWDYETNWYGEVSARKSIGAIFKNKKLSAKQQQEKISKIIAETKPSIFKFWRRAEYNRYTELERQINMICLTKSFLQGESDEVDLMTDLIFHFSDYQPHAEYFSPINSELSKGAPMIENLFAQYQENIASLEVHSAQGTSYSFIEGILRGSKTTPRSIPPSYDTFDQTLSSLRYLLKKSVNSPPIDEKLKQPQIASKIVSEQVAQALEIRMGLKG